MVETHISHHNSAFVCARITLYKIIYKITNNIPLQSLKKRCMKSTPKKTPQTQPRFHGQRIEQVMQWENGRAAISNTYRHEVDQYTTTVFIHHLEPPTSTWHTDAMLMTHDIDKYGQPRQQNNIKISNILKMLPTDHKKSSI